MAEYEALLGGLRIAIELNIKRLDIRGDSQLVIDQVMKNTSCHNEKMEAHRAEVRKLEDKFFGFELNHITRKYNKEVDKLANIASGRITIPLNIFARDIAKPSVNLDKPTASRNSSGADPSRHAGINPMDEDPTNGELEASNLEGSQADEAEAMEIDNLPPPPWDWRDEYLAWLDRGELPPKRIKARRVARKAMSVIVIDDELYKRRTSRIM
jgi:hypothetical protein